MNCGCSDQRAFGFPSWTPAWTDGCTFLSDTGFVLKIHICVILLWHTKHINNRLFRKCFSSRNKCILTYLGTQPRCGLWHYKTPLPFCVWQSSAIFHSCFNMLNWFMKHFNAPKHLILLFLPCSFKYLCNLVFVWLPALPRQSVCLHRVSDALWLTCRQFPIPKYLLNELRLNWGWTPACSSSEKTKRREEY